MYLDLVLKYVVQHFVFLHCFEVSSVGAPFRQGVEASLRVVVVVSWYDVFFLRE